MACTTASSARSRFLPSSSSSSFRPARCSWIEAWCGPSSSSARASRSCCRASIWRSRTESSCCTRCSALSSHSSMARCSCESTSRRCRQSAWKLEASSRRPSCRRALSTVGFEGTSPFSCLTPCSTAAQRSCNASTELTSRLKRSEMQPSMWLTMCSKSLSTCSCRASSDCRRCSASVATASSSFPTTTMTSPSLLLSSSLLLRRSSSTCWSKCATLVPISWSLPRSRCAEGAWLEGLSLLPASEIDSTLAAMRPAEAARPPAEGVLAEDAAELPPKAGRWLDQ
mmetsp:Transcript_115278/g.337030  ORF Transcript_115278/g.337030 Transcript_115278/m.337030 type:complete len:284 (+) Transcript_115278:289-1140(+)